MEQNEFLKEYEYSNYLEAWQDRFDSEESGIESYLYHGREIHHTLYKLSLSQFQNHIKKLKENWDTFDKALIYCPLKKIK